jgi:hypothetical protein
LSLYETRRGSVQPLPTPAQIDVSLQQEWGREPKVQEVAAVQQLLVNEKDEGMINAGIGLGALYLLTEKVHPGTRRACSHIAQRVGDKLTARFARLLAIGGLALGLSACGAGGWSSNAQTTFINGCVQSGGGTATSCQCVLNYYEAHETYAQYLDVGNSGDSGEFLFAENAVEACK